MKDLNIHKIGNGFILRRLQGYSIYDENTFYFKDMREVIKHLNTVDGEVEDLIDKIKSEKDKEQIRRVDTKTD